MVTNGMTIIEQNTMEAIQCINQKIPEIELRDLFAMAALQGILPTPYGQAASNENVSASAYAVADEMLKARKRK
jgi:hypothetical protein